MLKRQRPASPPPFPSFSETPFITDPVDLGLIDRHHKKRRTLPPSLDGASRGWAKPHEHHLARFSANNNNEEDEDEEYYESDTDNAQDALSRGNLNLINPHSYASSYKSTNELLRELHTVNQHRLLFASPAQSLNLGFSALPSGSGLQQQQHQFGSGNNGMHQNHNAPQLQHFDNASPASHHSSNSASNFGQSSDGMISPRREEWPRSASVNLHSVGNDKEDAVEVSRVTERYESTNRLLGSLFLSRRKQLEPLDGDESSS